MARQPKSMTPVKSWKEVPSFKSEKEEADFWRTHMPSANLLKEMRQLPDNILPPPRPRTRPVAVRFDEYTLRRIKALAARRRTGYQTLLKEFVSERLYEEERRDGVLRRPRHGNPSGKQC
jgi:predicted DNA binding CopG/RHH family protein